MHFYLVQKEMKKKFILITAIVACAIIYYGCEEKEEAPKPPGPTPPTADFTWEITNNQTRTVEFTNTSSLATSYSWDFGDASTSTAVSPQHSFPSYSTFNVKLTAHGQGGSNIKTQSVTVIP